MVSRALELVVLASLSKLVFASRGQSGERCVKGSSNEECPTSVELLQTGIEIEHFAVDEKKIQEGERCAKGGSHEECPASGELVQTGIEIEDLSLLQHGLDIQHTHTDTKAGGPVKRFSLKPVVLHTSSVGWGVPGKHCLNFLHIPKTAGTSVEEASLDIVGSQGAAEFDGWGKHDSQLQCEHTRTLRGLPACNVYVNSRELSPTSIWHFPPSWDSKLADSYKKCTTFCIVRNPLDRAVSEWKHVGGCMGRQGDVNTFIRTKLHEAQSDPFVGDGHWLPQTEYIRGHVVTIDGKTSSKGEYCQRVLRFENLTAEFISLMEEFNFSVTLGEENAHKPCEGSDLDDETRSIARRFYAEDFARLGYAP